MFGGLEVKTKVNKETKEEEAPPPVAAAPAPGSAFSFLSTTTTPAPAPAAAAAAASGFSFLQSTSSSEAAEPTATESPALPPPAAAPSGSAFDFLSGGAPAANAPPAPALEPEAEANASSSFGFLSTPATTEATTTTVAATETSSLGFSFLAGGGGGSNAPAPAAATELSDASPTATDLLSVVAPSAAGSGVVFGGAMATKPKKKRNRANKIGVGASSAATTTAAAVAPTTTTAMTPAASLAAAQEDTKTKALEATHRAEAFLQEKMAQQHQTVDAARSTANNNSGPPPSLQKAPSLDREDEDVAKALEAAKAAQQQMAAAAKPQRSHFGLGGLFRSTGGNAAAPAATNQRTISSSSMHSNKSTDSRGKASAGTTTTTKTEIPATTTEETPNERLQREQEEVKRAMAERELQMRKEAAPIAATAPPPTTLEIPNYGAPSKPAPLPDPKAAASIPAAPQTTTGGTAAAPKLSMNSSNFSFMAPRPVAPVVKKKPVPVRRETATDNFVAMMREFSNKVTASMAEIQRLRQHKSGLLEQRFQTVAKQRLAIQQKAIAENQQMAAAEEEDFELADRLNTLIATHEREDNECTAILENIGRALEQLESQKTGLVKRITGHFSDIQKKLHKFQEEQESKETEDVTETLQKFSVVSKQLSAENERLQGELKSLERDSKLVDEERAEVEKTIAEQAGVYEKLRDDARAQVQVLEEEIEEMRKKLQEKQKIAAQLRTEAAGHEEEVLKVRVKFSRQLGRVNQKELSLQHNKEDWEREKEAFEAQREEHEAEVEAHSEALVARDKLLATLKTEVEMADTFEDIVGKEIGFEVTSNEETPDEELTGLQAEVVQSEASLSEAKEVLQTAVNHLASLETETSTLETRIAILEDTKKAAAAKRDFKAAAKATKDLKEAVSRLQECQSEISSSALERKQTAEEECKRLEENLLSKRSVALEKEKDAGKATMQRLADNMKRLLATKEAVCANAEEDSVQGVGALVLDAQIEALQFEGKTYGEKYGGWDELVADLGVAENESPKGSSPGSTEPEKAVEAPPSADEITSEPESPLTPVSNEEKNAAMKEFRELSAKMAELNVSIEEAAASDDFEKAAELDEELNAVAERIESLGLSDDDMAAAFQVSEEPAEASVEAPADNNESAQVDAQSTDNNEAADVDAQSTDVAPEDVPDKGETEESQPIDDEKADTIVEKDTDGDASADGQGAVPVGVESNGAPADELVQESGSGNEVADTEDKGGVANGGENVSAAPVSDDDEL